MVGATITVTPYSAKAMARLSGGNVSARIACAMGCNPPPPAPCRMRKKIIAPRLGAKPHSSELTVKIARQIMKKRLRPKTLAHHPLIGSTTAFDTRYDVSTHVLWSVLAPRLPPMYGSATFAMLVSSTSMKAATATTTPMSQGLYFGCHAGKVTGAAVATVARVDGPSDISGLAAIRFRKSTMMPLGARRRTSGVTAPRAQNG